MTREEAKAFLQSRIDLIDKCYPNEVDDYREALETAIEALEQEPKWIPVSERLPEDKQSVLVWCPQYQNIYCAYLEKEQWWIFGAFVQIVPNEVEAWMPLPKPYNEESEDRE